MGSLLACWRVGRACWGACWENTSWMVVLLSWAQARSLFGTEFRHETSHQERSRGVYLKPQFPTARSYRITQLTTASSEISSTRLSSHPFTTSSETRNGIYLVPQVVATIDILSYPSCHQKRYWLSLPSCHQKRLSQVVTRRDWVPPCSQQPACNLKPFTRSHEPFTISHEP